MMPAAILSLLVKTEGATAAAAQLRRVDSAAKGTSRTLDKSTAAAKKHSGVLGTLGKTAGLAGVALGGAGLAKGISTAVSEYREAQKVGAQTNAVLKSTGGAANVTKKHIENLAGAISKKAGIDDEAIQASENMLLTFTKVRNEAGKGNKIFDQATQTVTDMSVALGQSGKSSAIQLGKALNDPIKGITALRRVGVSFTAQQQDQIKKLENTGHHLEAQKMILKELKTEFGGSAAAQATAGDKMRVALSNLAEAAGRILVPAMDKVMTVLTNVINQFIQGKGIATVIIPVFLGIRDAVVSIVSVIAGLVRGFQQGNAGAVLLGMGVAALTAGFVAYKTFMLASAVATKGMAIAQGLLNIAMTANPVGIVIVALVALAAALFVAYKKSETFRNIIDTLWGVLKTVFNWVKSNWPLLLAILTGPFGLAVLMIVKHADAIKNAVVGAFHALIGAVKALGGAIAGLGTWVLRQIVAGVKGYVSVWLAIGGWLKDRLVGAFNAIVGAVRGIGGWILHRIIDGVKADVAALLNVGKWVKDRFMDGLRAVGGAIGEMGGWVLHRFITGLTSVGDAIKNAAKMLVDKVVGAVKGFLGISSPSKVFEDIGQNMMKGLINGMGATDVLKFVGKHLGGAAKLAADLAGNVVGSLTTSGRTNAGTSQIKGLGRQLAAGFGWSSGAEWSALDALWTKESGWNPMARNKASGAFGIPQALPPTKMPAAAQRGEPGSQIAWGLNYIKGRYGDPLSAWAHEKASGWYARGGKVPGQGTGDTVPAMLTPGEFVIRKSAVDKLGPAFFAGLNGYSQGGSVTLANLLSSKFGLHMTSGYRSAKQNAAVGGVPNSWHTKGSPSNPGAIDLVGAMSQMYAALAWVKKNVPGLAEAMVHNVGSGLHLHIAGQGLMHFKGTSEDVTKAPKKVLAQHKKAANTLATEKARERKGWAKVKATVARATAAKTVNRTLENPWLQAYLGHQDYLVASGALTQAQGNANKTTALTNALPQLPEKDKTAALGMISDMAPTAAAVGDAVTNEGARLSHIQNQVRAGDITAEEGKAAQIASIQDALDNWILTDDERLQLRGDLRELTMATTDNTDAIKAQADALNALKDEVKRQTDFATSVASTEASAMAKWVTEVISKQMGFNIGGRGQTPGYGVARRT